MSTTLARNATRLAIIAWTAVSSVTACSNSTPVTPVAPPAAHILALTGAAQLIAPVGSIIPSVSVQVTDASGAPIGGERVTWNVYNGGTVSSAASETDGNGIATVDWTFGTVAEADSLQATVGSNVSTYIVGTAQAGPVAQLVEVSGNQQTLAEGASIPLTVEAVDQYGNAVAGVTVAWIDQNGGALSSTATVTDANGLAQVVFTADQAPEQYVIVAQAASVTATFLDVSN